MPQLSCRDLTLGYEGKTVITGLSFAVEAGAYLCIVGENGSGKSTLMRTILGLKEPVSGRVEIGRGLLPSEIGYLPQQTVVQKDFPASVWEVVRSGNLNRQGLRPFYNRLETRITQDSMRRLGITALAKRCYRELSGGQQQRVLLARALCATRKLLLLDEPTAGLDPQAAMDLYALIERLNHEGITIIMISHDIAAAVKYAGHILHLGGQGALYCGTKEGYLKSDAGRIYANWGGEQA